MENKPISQPFLESPGNVPRPKRKAKGVLVAVNFRVPFEFRQRMKLSATIRGITMTELLTAAFEHYIDSTQEAAPNTSGPGTHHLTNFFAADLGPQR